jgi:hypothetical protein
MSLSVKPFKIEADKAKLDLLKSKLATTIFPDTSLPNDDWAYGIPTHVVKELKEYWETKYDWAAAEKKLNRHPHFKAEVNGIDLHFVHVPSKNKDAVPLWVDWREPELWTSSNFLIRRKAS